MSKHYALASRINDIVRDHDPEQHLCDGGNTALIWKIEAELNKALAVPEELAPANADLAERVRSLAIRLRIVNNTKNALKEREEAANILDEIARTRRLDGPGGRS